MILARRAIGAVLTASALVCCANASATSYFSGTVTDTLNQPIAGATVIAGHQTFSFVQPFVIDGQAMTDAQGQYAITTLAPDSSGAYVVAARATGYVTVLYPDLPCYSGEPLCLDLAPLGAPVAPPIANANFQMTRPGTISGHVSRVDTNAPVSTLLTLARTDGADYPYGITVSSDSNGDYTVSAFPGSYHAETTGASAGSPGLFDQIYAGHDYDSTYPPDAMTSLGDAIAVAEGQNVTGIDFPLNTGGFFTGNLTSALNGAAVTTGISVHRLQPVDSGVDYVPVATSADYGSPNPGSYMSIPLAPGVVKVYFGDNDAFVPQYFPGAPDESQAQEVIIVGGQIVTGIDAVLTPLQTIAGNVFDLATNNPLPGNLVHVGFDFAGPQIQASALSDASGNYLLQGISSGLGYTVWVDDVRGYTGAAYPMMLTPASGDNVSGIDIGLQPGAYASGRIYDPDTGAGAVAAYAQLYDANGVAVGGIGPLSMYDAAPSDAQGNYFSPAVPAGQYYLGVNTAMGTYLYPAVACGANPCDFSQAQLLDMSVVQEYPNLDFVIPHLDLIFRGNFE